MKKTGYERQQTNGEFWRIDGIGDICNCYDVNTNADKMYNTANYYSDKTVAINNARADNLIRRLRRFAVEHNEEEIDWTNEHQTNFYIAYDYTSKKLGVSIGFSIREVGAVYFSSRSVANKALDAFYNEILWYFQEYCDHVVEDKEERVDEGCDLCKSGNLDNVGIGNNRIWFCGGNTKPQNEEKVKFCPQCGRRLD